MVQHARWNFLTGVIYKLNSVEQSKYYILIDIILKMKLNVYLDRYHVQIK